MDFANQLRPSLMDCARHTTVPTARQQNPRQHDMALRAGLRRLAEAGDKLENKVRRSRATPTTIEPFPFFALARELRDLVYAEIAADVQTHSSPDGGYNFAIENLVYPPVLRLNKQFASELQETINCRAASPPKLILTDHGIKTDFGVPEFPEFFLRHSAKVQQLDINLSCTVDWRHHDLRDHVNMVGTVMEMCGQASSVHIKLYMQRKAGQTSQDFHTILRSSRIDSKVQALRVSSTCVKSFGIYSCDRAIASCAGIEEAVGETTSLIKRWTEGTGWQMTP